MKIERTKNAARNIVFGIILKIFHTFVPFLMRTAMINYIGIQYLGLNSFFTSVLQMLNLTELGVGNAMVYSMYKPVAEDDTEKVCALMRLYRTYYRVIGLVVMVLGIILLPFIPYLIKDEPPENVNIYVLYVLYLCSTVLSYWLFAYKNSVLYANQREDVGSKVMLFTHSLQYITQFLALCLFRNYYMYVIILIATQALTNIVTAIESNKLFPQYKPVGHLSKEDIKTINRSIRDIFTSKLGYVVTNSADTIVISAFLNLTILAIYQNYYLIITSIIAFMTIIFNACTAGIGNSLLVETQEKNFNDLKKFTFLTIWVTGLCCCCFLCMFQPFMILWMGEENLLPFGVVVCIVIYYFVYEIDKLFCTFKNAAGIWRQDRFRPLITAGANLVMNLIMVQFWGIYGIVLSTVLSTVLVGLPWLLYNLFTTVFEKKYFLQYFKKFMFYVIIVAVACAMCCIVNSVLPFKGILALVAGFLTAMIVPNALFFLCFYKTKEFGECVRLVDNMTKGKLKLAKRLHK